MLNRAIMAMIALFLSLNALRAKETDAKWLAQRIRAIKQSEPRDWEQIPWVKGLVEARALAQKQQSPIFVFTYDGNLEKGRC